jgi:3-oxoacyl-[acyl-carrier protein] reductase
LKLKRLADLSVDEIVEDVHSILLGGILAARAALPLMEEGAVVGILSEATETTPARMTSYVAAKSGLRGFARSLAAELRATRVRSIGISPSMVETELIRSFPSKLVQLERARRSGRLLSPDDVAATVVAALKDEDRFPNGTLISL